MLCTVQQAREAGATGTDPEVSGWIDAATERITRYTSQLFEPTTVAVVADVGAEGLVILPRRVRTITSVTPVSRGLVDAPSLPSSAYRVTSSSTLGAVDAVRLSYCGWNDLVAGAESYSGGWANLVGGVEQVTVVGSFGYDAPPAVVPQACALLAAHMQAEARPSDADATVDTTLDVDDEGNNVRITDDDGSSDAADRPSATTGLPVADVLLAPYINATARPLVWGL